MWRRWNARAWVLIVAAIVLVSGCTSSGQQQSAQDPSSALTLQGPRGWLVTLGDSYISGEGARWAGNTSKRAGPVDALGADAYDDSASHEAVPGCHRAEFSEASVDTRQLRGKNLACSGATTRSHTSGGVFKPGLDSFRGRGGRVGQLLALQRFAQHHRVRAIVVSIGGNDFGFGSVVASCVTTFFATLGGDQAYCKNGQAARTALAPAHVAQVTRHLTAALRRVAATMTRAGYRSGEYRLIVQNYPSPIPSGGQFRYRETLLMRFLVGGCGVYDTDASWANRVLLPTINGAVGDAVRRSRLAGVVQVDMSDAFEGHRLCEQGAHQLEETDLTSWRSPGASDQLEWVNMIYTKSEPWQLQESLHPNYWGVRAMRACVRAAVDEQSARSGRCQDGRFIPQ